MVSVDANMLVQCDIESQKELTKVLCSDLMQTKDLCECSTAKIDPQNSKVFGMAVEDRVFPTIDLREK